MFAGFNYLAAMLVLSNSSLVYNWSVLTLYTLIQVFASLYWTFFSLAKDVMMLNIL